MAAIDDKEKKHKHRDKGKDRDRDRDREREPDSDRKHRDSGKADRSDRDRLREDRDRRDKDKRDSKHKHRDKLNGDSKPAEADVEARPASEARDQPLPPPPQPPAAPVPAEAQPAHQPQVQESGGEVSMSIEETNRLRISLGLKPLSLDSGKEAREKEQAAKRAQQAEAEKQAKAEELAERVQKAKEKRQLAEHYRSVKTLGEAAPEVDDLGAWVAKSRTLEQQRRAEEQAKADRLARQFEEQDAEAEESDDERPGAAPLAGLKVKHGADELGQGETMILTLADRNILDESGELDEAVDELENVRAAELKKREKAKREAQGSRHQPLFEEDGRRRGLLDKYDEEEEDAGMTIDEAGGLDDVKRRQEEIRRRLATGSAIVDSATTSTQIGYNSRSEYYTAEEMTQFEKPKKRKKKKLRKKEGDGELAVNIAALEAEAAAAGRSDLGSRKARIAQALAEANQHSKESQVRQDRYNHALEKANLAAQALLPAPSGTSAADEDEDEDELYAARLAAERQAKLAVRAAKAENGAAGADGGIGDVAAEIAARRAQDEARERSEAEQGGLEFTEAAEFARAIQLSGPEEEAQPAPANDQMDYEQEEAPTPPAPTPMPARPKREEPAQPSKWGNWVSAENGVQNGIDDEDMPQAEAITQPTKKEHIKAAAVEDHGITRERLVGTGLAGALSLLKDRGELTKPVEWSGRTNDMKPEKLQGLEDVYRGGQHEDRIAAGVERALTQRDEYGRVMTPKERFRQLCYRFHGKGPSKNKREAYQRKAADDVAAKRSATSEVAASATLQRMQTVQKAGAAPYVVLSGNVKPGQSADPMSGYATVDGSTALTPMLGALGGSQTPLLGNKKVEAMLGIKREGGAMLPPPARRPKNEH